ncbi:phosphoribosylanthranilate isomerase [Pectobacterium aroidearum]|uniref:phosphoribosylanthranilate isomerase n=1 Tax=Pectobacterium aroidearum TaxID=1201031 RepID=UPI0032ED64FC
MSMQPSFVKVCGLTTQEQIDWAIELGYDAVGIVASPRSKRYCPPGKAIELAAHARSRIHSFVVAMTSAEAAEVAGHFDTVQLYEMAAIPNLAFSSAHPPEAPELLQYFVYDASIGSGTYQEIPDWVKEVRTRVLLAGGLTADNVAGLARLHNAFGVDVSSGVESAPGVKSPEKMQAFILAARS